MYIMLKILAKWVVLLLSVRFSQISTISICFEYLWGQVLIYTTPSPCAPLSPPPPQNKTPNQNKTKTKKT